jgi:hypothetical protein
VRQCSAVARDDASQSLKIPQPGRRTLTELKDGLFAILVGILAHLLTVGIQHVLDKGEVNFPPSIVGMVCVFAIFWALDWVVSGMDEFYQQNLKPAVSLRVLELLLNCFQILTGQADLLNRHMSIGFTIPFIMICRNPFSDARTVGMVIVCFSKQHASPNFEDIWLILDKF